MKITHFRSMYYTGTSQLNGELYFSIPLTCESSSDWQKHIFVKQIFNLVFIYRIFRCKLLFYGSPANLHFIIYHWRCSFVECNNARARKLFITVKKKLLIAKEEQLSCIFDLRVCFFVYKPKFIKEQDWKHKVYPIQILIQSVLTCMFSSCWILDRFFQG